MKFIADLHTHSRYSMATSANSDLNGLLGWARIKGINVVGTGDFTHPAWMSELKQLLIPAEPGLFALKEENAFQVIPDVDPEAIPVRFMLSSEISCIYKKGGKTRKIHTLIYVPDFKAAEKISDRLSKIGNIHSDGRPILGLDARDLLEIVLETSADGFMVPAHVWTPWFSLFGSKSGFNSVEECFGDLSRHIFALETGLSSDPAMNRLISDLDRFSLISSSDCHSPSKLGREANLFDTDLDYYSIKTAIQNPSEGGFHGTMEFFPEEGKYYFDGHRRCGVGMSPDEARQHQNLCPVCGKELTEGVLSRVLELADRDVPNYPEGQAYFEHLISLQSILSEILNVGMNTKTVMTEYQNLISTFGSEFSLLRDVSVADIAKVHSDELAEAIQRMRTGNLTISPGFDGQFGQIRALK